MSGEVERISGSFHVCRPIFEIFTDFANYSGLKPNELATMLVDEQSHLFDDLTIETLALAHQPQRRVFPEHLKVTPKKISVSYQAHESTLDRFNEHADRFCLTVPWIARVAMLHGLALEMEAEKYTPATVEELAL